MLRRTRTPWHLVRLVLAIWLGLGPGPGPAVAQLATEAGRPQVRNFAPREFGADSQNWAVARAASGLLYVANNLGVLEFDGVSWRLIPTRDGTTPRTLAAGPGGRIYVGGTGEFGYLEPDRSGQTRYVALDDRLAPADRFDGEIWSIGVTGEGVFVQTRDRLVRWDGVRMRTWKPQGGFFLGYQVQGRYLVLENGRGLVEPHGDALERVPGGQLFIGHKPRFLVPWPRPGRPELLWGSREDGINAFDGRAQRRLPTQADRYLADSILYSGILLSDGTLALATIQGGVVILDPLANRVRQLGKDDGLTDATSYCLFEDPGAGLWVGGSRGLAYVDWPPRLTRYDEASGLGGVVLDLCRQGRTLYASTSRGLYQLLGHPGRFVPVAGIKGQCWGFVGDPGSLLVANYDGIYEVRRGTAHRVTGATGHTTCLLRSGADPDQVFAGTVTGLFALRRSSRVGPWRIQGRVAGVGEDIRTLAWDPAGALWAGCDAPLAIRVDLPRSGPALAHRFGPASGLPDDPWYFTVKVAGRAEILTPSGLFRPQDGSGRFGLDPRILPLLEGAKANWFRVAEAEDGGLWISSRRDGTLIRRARLDPAAGYRWDGAAVPEFTGAPVFAIHPEADGTVWFGGIDGLFRLDSRIPGRPPGPAPVLIRSILKGDGQPLAAAGAGPIPYAQASLRFTYAMPPFNPFGTTRYQILLEGRDRDWSPWSTEAYRDYTNLREGRYRFRVRARVREGEPSQETSFAFRIRPPWRRTWWAYGLYLASALLVLGLAHRLRIRILQRRNLELQNRVDHATASLASQAAELERANAALRDLNEQKTRFLGIVSHDLKSPLTGIVQAAETLRQSREEQVRLTADAIEKEGLAMGALISRFLGVTALESGRLQVRTEPVDLVARLDQALDRHRLRAAAKGIALEFEPPPSVWIEADPLLLGEVLDNLLSNALKFSAPGQPVRVVTRTGAGRAQVAVTDRGPGIRPEDRERLFTRFAQLSARPTAGEATMGLGLFIARQLVTAMNGQIWADPEPGPGATFRLELPISSSPVDSQPRQP
jgi:signal transduction histidine kinase